MARVLAVDWNRHEARYVLASTRGGKVKVDVVEAMPLVDVAEGGAEPRPDLSGSLAAWLTETKAGRVSALVGVERSSIELLHLTLPPAKDAELPELVANQAMRESQLIGDSSIIDFFSIDDDPAAPRSVIAAAITRDELARIEQTCLAAGVKPARMLLRPFASASLFVRAAEPSEDAYLLVNRFTDEADLTIVVDQKPVFFRTVRLPEGGSEAEATARLLAEVKRTLAAAPQTHLGDEAAECVYLFGRAGDHQELVEQIRDEVDLPAKVFDPFEALRVGEELVPEDSGRFAPLLGMLLDEAAGSHAVDLLHPRKRPQPVNRARIAIIAAGLLVAVVLGIAFNTWSKLSEINRENQDLKEQLRLLNETAKKAAGQNKMINAIAEWQRRDVIWLDELRDLSLRFPSSRDVVVLRMSMSTSSQSGRGTIDLQGLVRDPRIVFSIEGNVRDDFRHVSGKRTQQRASEKDYTWLFETSMAVARRRPSQYVSHLPPDEQPAAQAADGQLAARPTEEESPEPSQAVVKAKSSSTGEKVRKASQ